ncbi:MAG: hypothetical protein ACK53Y_15365 [bacterium]
MGEHVGGEVAEGGRAGGGVGGRPHPLLLHPADRPASGQQRRPSKVSSLGVNM